MKKYKESLSATPEPILLSQCPQIKLDLRGLMKYARAQGKAVVELTEKEKSTFIENFEAYQNE